MHLRPKLAALLAAVVLFSSFPPTTLRADPGPVAVAPLPPVTETDGRFGLVQSMLAPDLALAAGARWDRIVFPWSLIQKDGPDSWNELYFTDEQIRAQARRGITMTGVIIATPQWASIDPPRGRPVDRPQGLNLPYNDPTNHWGQFVRKLAARHKGVVDHWIIWNEPDLFDMAIRYTWDASYEEYFQLLKVAYLNVKEVNPNAKVILGGLAYWYDKEYGRPPYLGPLFEVIGRDPDHRRHNHYFDAVAVHTYSAPLNSYTQPLIMKEIMDLRGVKKPIWINEGNVIPYNDPRNPLPPGQWRATLDQQASYVIQSLALGLAAGVERHALYKAVDEAPENDIELWGLIRNDRSVKPSYVAYQVATTYFSNVKSAVYSWPGSSEVPTPAEVKAVLSSADRRPQFIWPAQVSQVTMERGPRRTTVVWNNSPSEVAHRVPATARQATLVTKYGKTETIAPRDGFYTLDLPIASHNAEQRDFSIYMIGGEPLIVDEQVSPLPSDRVASRIEIVWPHNSAPQREAEKANVVAQLLMPYTDGEPVPCRYNPQTVQLWRRVNGGPREFVTNGTRRFAEEGGVRYPVWDFTGISVADAQGGPLPTPTPTPVATGTPVPSPSAGPRNRFSPAVTATPGPVSAADATLNPSAEPTAVPTPEGPKDYIEFSVVVDGTPTDAVSWIYGGLNATDWTQPPVRPKRSCD